MLHGVKNMIGSTTMLVLMLHFVTCAIDYIYTYLKCIYNLCLCMRAEHKKKFLASKKREPAFITNGFTYWKEATTAFNHRLYIHLPGIAYRAISKEQSALYQSTPFLCRVSIALVGEGSHIGRAVPF